MTRVRHTTTAILTAVLLLLPGSMLVAQEALQPEIEDIVVEGGVTLTPDTLSYYLGLEPGDPLDLELVQEGFRRLWDAGLVEELRIEREDLPGGGVVLHVIVQERPFVRSVLFEGNKKLSGTDLKDKLDERGVEVPRNVPLKMGDLTRIANAVKEVYDEQGYRSAGVDYRVEDVGRTEKRVVFEVDEGDKVKIREIDFAGNEVFSDSRLQRVLKKTKKVKFYRPFGKKVLYSDADWEEDRENLRKFYLNHGYKDVKVGTPEVDLVAANPNVTDLEKRDYFLHIVVPVEEGDPYALGTLQVTGVEVLRPEGLRQLFDIQDGDRYRFKAIEQGIESLQNLYQNQGYIYAYARQVLTDREDVDDIVDVSIEVYEGDRYRLGRLEFQGNSMTQEKVLRREFHVSEGDWMSMGSFRRSVFKMNALGFFKLEEDPLEFDFDDENKRVNVIVKGQEVGRNDIQFGAGYSELDGLFGQMQFNTRNFLGRGNTLGVSVQSGRRTDYYHLSFTEPYLFDRRIMLGGALFNTSLEIADFYRETKGASVTTGMGLRVFDSVSLLLSYEDVESRFAVSRQGVPGDPTGGHGRPVGLPSVEFERPEVTYETFKGTTAAATPAYGFDSRDDPFDPNRGRRLTFRSRFAGGPLGGDFDYVRPELSLTQFKSVRKKSIVAFNLEVGQFLTYDESDIPIYERYRLGGDRSLRGIPYYTVLPRTEDGEYFLSPGGSRLGGDRYWQLNLEYQYRIGGPVKLVLFGDFGNTYHETQGWDMGSFRRTTGVELRVFLPMFQAPIRFIYGINLDPFEEEDSSDFQFSIGTTF